jgi:hypothetical protein
MQYTTVALALSGAALTKAANIGGMMPAGEFIARHNLEHYDAEHVATTHSKPQPYTLTNAVPTIKFDLGVKSGLGARAIDVTFVSGIAL